MKYRNRGALIDTNLMLLFVVGSYDRSRISRFKRTLEYLPSDFDLVSHVIRWFDKLVTTPNILTEVDNLARQMPEAEHRAISDFMSQGFSGLFESYIATSDAVSHPAYARIGLTDATTILTASHGYLVVTDDFPLAMRLESLDRDVLNINHLRTLFIR